MCGKFRICLNHIVGTVHGPVHGQFLSGDITKDAEWRAEFVNPVLVCRMGAGPNIG